MSQQDAAVAMQSRAAASDALVKLAAHLGIVLFAVAFFRIGYEIWRDNWTLADLRVYHTGAEALLQGKDIYSVASPKFGLLFTYPPFAAFAFIPISILPLFPTLVASIPLSALALVVAVNACLCAAIPDWSATLRWPAALLLASTLAFAEPVEANFELGQINLVLLALVLYDVLPTSNKLPRGILVGFATAIKLTPGIFILYFIVTKRFRAATVASGTFLALSLFAFILKPGLSRQYWFETLFQSERLGNVEYLFNQSLRGTVARLSGSPTANVLLWEAMAIVTLLIGLALTAWAHRRGLELLGLGICCVTGLLISPYSWHHHWVFAIPAGVALWAIYLTYRQRFALIAAYGWTFIYGFGPIAVAPFSVDGARGPEFEHRGVDLLLGNLFVVTAVALLVTAPLLIRRSGLAWASQWDGVVIKRGFWTRPALSFFRRS